MKILRKAPLVDLTLEEMRASLVFENSTESLLEHLEIDKLLISQNGSMNGEELFPLTEEIIYQYDFGDDWTVKVGKESWLEGAKSF